MITLSICIATYNRAQFIGETLEAILPQLDEDIELIVVDGASTDNTKAVVLAYSERCPRVRYFCEETNSGVDKDFDKAVGYARGEYCWLMSDDDLLKPSAIQKVRRIIADRPELVVINAEVRNSDLSVLLESRRLHLYADQYYEKSDRESFFKGTLSYLTFIGCVVISRDFWMSRDRHPYYGSLFIHVGVICQHPPVSSVRIISEPLIVIRYGNATWTSRYFDVWMFKWPSLVWSFPDFSDTSKQLIARREPWRRFGTLVNLRAIGAYSRKEFELFLANRLSGFAYIMSYLVASLPALLTNLIAILYLGLFNRTGILAAYDLLQSPHATKISLALAKVFRLPDKLWKGSSPCQEQA